VRWRVLNTGAFSSHFCGPSKFLDKTALHGFHWAMDESPNLVDLSTDEGRRAARSLIMAEMGRKGGQANKGKAADKCRNAALARWAKYREQAQEDEDANNPPQEGA